MKSRPVNDHSEFFADVLRPPAVRKESGGKLRVRLFDARQFLAEFAIIALLGFLFLFWLSRYAGPWAYLVLFVLVTGYAVLALTMKRMDELTRIEINDGRLFLDEVECAGTIDGIVCVNLSGHEDGNNPEHGSSRIYVVMKDNHDSVVIPLLISCADLRPGAKRLASALACSYQYGRGLASLPKKVRSLNCPVR